MLLYQSKTATKLLWNNQEPIHIQTFGLNLQILLCIKDNLGNFFVSNKSRQLLTSSLLLIFFQQRIRQQIQMHHKQFQI